MARAEAVLQVTEQEVLERVRDAIEADESTLVEAVINHTVATKPEGWRRLFHPTAGPGLASHEAVQTAAANARHASMPNGAAQLTGCKPPFASPGAPSQGVDRQWDRRTRITDRKFEVNELVGMFLGIGPQRLYELLTFLYLFGLLYGPNTGERGPMRMPLITSANQAGRRCARWGFAAIFGTTLASIVPVVGLSSNTWPWCVTGRPVVGWRRRR